MTLKVLIVDDHEVARRGVSELLQVTGFFVEGSVSTGQEALLILQGGGIDVVLLDVQMPQSDGLATLERIREAHVRLPVVVFSAYDNPTYIARAAALGAQDYVVKNCSFEVLGECLRRAANGGGPIANSRLARIQQLMSEEVDVQTLPPELPLTSREAQVLRHIGLGLSNREIARSLTISIETVKEHVQNILRKINATDRTDAAVRAVKLGLVD